MASDVTEDEGERQEAEATENDEPSRSSQSSAPAPKKSEKKDDIIDKMIKALQEANKLRKPYRLATAGMVSAIIAGLLKAQSLTATFPEPWGTYANVILFAAIVAMAIDLMLAGLAD